MLHNEYVKDHFQGDGVCVTADYGYVDDDDDDDGTKISLFLP